MQYLRDPKIEWVCFAEISRILLTYIFLLLQILQLSVLLMLEEVNANAILNVITAVFAGVNFGPFADGVSICFSCCCFF